MDKDFVLKWSSQLKKGTLSFIILKILDQGTDFYGYDLINELKNKTSIQIAEGTLYPLMNRLKSENLVVSNWVEQSSGIPRKYYSITSEGKKVVVEMSVYWSNLNQIIHSI
ncbi:PadR family transcriptional regulator [Sphingobacterium chungjuense]|uniref:PadR family transcriptional regulator n=1 Tax=Sphingobacterium chungjuense TaxID=2675553 RepID=UPI00140CDCBA|nr:PadR family transcriptional regulator [Sphingobacterium chungjuense]